MEALLVNEELADQVWEAWDAGEIDDRTAQVAWQIIADSILLLRLSGDGQENHRILGHRVREHF